MNPDNVRRAVSELCQLVGLIEDKDDQHHVYVTIGMLMEFLPER